MEIVLPGPNPAYSTSLTVILFFVLVKQVANITVIFSKLYMALLTGLLCLLHRLTLGALHLLHFEAVHFMVLLCIMTQSANIQFTTARCF